MFAEVTAATLLTDCQNYFTDRLSSKFVTKQYLIVPANLKDVATLPCEIFVYREWYFWNTVRWPQQSLMINFDGLY